MSNLITAKEAKDLSELADYNKEADELLKPIIGRIKSGAEKGRTHITIDGRDWYKTLSQSHRLAIKKLIAAGYAVIDNEYEYAPNGGRPDTFYGIKISWS